MIKFLYVGDWHLKGANPRNRKDNYKEATKLKLQDLFELAVENKVVAILTPGDIWDTPEVSIGILLEFAEILSKSPVPIYTTVGNHDIYGYSVDTYNRTSLKLLDLLVPNFHVVSDSKEYIPFYMGGSNVIVTFTPFSGQMDVKGYGYSPDFEIPLRDKYINIHVCHGMLLDHTPPFDKFTLVDDVKTTADVVLCGHVHVPLGNGVIKRYDGKVFCNPGSLTRMAASEKEIERTPQVALIKIENKAVDIQLIPLKSAKPGEEVLDRSKIEAESQRQYSMSQFAALMQTKTGDKVLIDVNSIVEAIATADGFDPEVVKIALDTIDAQRETVKG